VSGAFPGRPGAQGPGTAPAPGIASLPSRPPHAPAEPPDLPGRDRVARAPGACSAARGVNCHLQPTVCSPPPMCNPALRMRARPPVCSPFLHATPTGCRHPPAESKDLPSCVQTPAARTQTCKYSLVGMASIWRPILPTMYASTVGKVPSACTVCHNQTDANASKFKYLLWGSAAQWWRACFAQMPRIQSAAHTYRAHCAETHRVQRSTCPVGMFRGPTASL
jgi:hypothetical protein